MKELGRFIYFKSEQQRMEYGSRALNYFTFHTAISACRKLRYVADVSEPKFSNTNLLNLFDQTIRACKLNSLNKMHQFTLGMKENS